MESNSATEKKKTAGYVPLNAGLFKKTGSLPIPYHGTGIFTYIWVVFMVNVGKYTIHGSYGL